MAWTAMILNGIVMSFPVPTPSTQWPCESVKYTPSLPCGIPHHGLKYHWGKISNFSSGLLNLTPCSLSNFISLRILLQPYQLFICASKTPSYLYLRDLLVIPSIWNVFLSSLTGADYHRLYHCSNDREPQRYILLWFSPERMQSLWAPGLH